MNPLPLEGEGRGNRDQAVEALYRHTEFARTRRVSVEGHEVFIVAPEAPVLSQLAWAKHRVTSREMLRARSGDGRLTMECSMHQFAKMLVRGSVLDRHPQATQAELRRELFLHFYGSDFDAATRDRICAAPEQAQQRAAAPSRK